MPVYEYHCTACGTDFEYEHRMSDPRKTVCEACGGELERLISRTSFAFKGGGWYKDLYATPKAGSSGSGESGGGSSGGSSSGGSSDGGGGSSSDGGGSSSGGSTPSTPSTPSSGSGSGTSAAAAS